MEFSFRSMRQTEDWSEFRKDLMANLEDPSGLTGRISIPDWLTSLVGVPQTDDVIVQGRSSNVLRDDAIVQGHSSNVLRAYFTIEKWGRRRTHRVRRHVAGSAFHSAPESVWIEHAIPYERLATPDEVKQVLGSAMAVELEDYLKEWLGPGSLVCGLKDNTPSNGIRDYLMTVTWSGFGTMQQPGIPWRSSYQPSSEYQQFIIANPEFSPQLWRPHPEFASSLRFGGPGSYVTQYQGQYTSNLVNYWRPEQRIPLGLMSLDRVHEGNVPAHENNEILKRQEEAYFKMLADSPGHGVEAADTGAGFTIR